MFKPWQYIFEGPKKLSTRKLPAEKKHGPTKRQFRHYVCLGIFVLWVFLVAVATMSTIGDIWSLLTGKHSSSSSSSVPATSDHLHHQAAEAAAAAHHRISLQLRVQDPHDPMVLKSNPTLILDSCKTITGFAMKKPDDREDGSDQKQHISAYQFHYLPIDFKLNEGGDHHIANFTDPKVSLNFFNGNTSWDHLFFSPNVILIEKIHVSSTIQEAGREAPVSNFDQIICPRINRDIWVQ